MSPDNITHDFFSEGLRKLADLISPELKKLMKNPDFDLRKFMGEQGKTHTNMDAATKKPFWHFNNKGKWVYSALGPNHRQVGHDPISIGIMSLLGQANPIDALLHIGADKIWSDLKDIVFNRKKKRYL